MFYLVGVDHTVQAKPKGVELTEEQHRFRLCLIEAIKTSEPVLVAEEYSQHAIAMRTKDTGLEHESVTEPIARALGVEHRFCDPARAIREQMGYMESAEIVLELDWGTLSQQEINDKALAIEIAKFWPMREEFWLDQIGAQSIHNVIFVLGNGHIDTFQASLKKNKIDSTVFAADIGVRQNDDGLQRLQRAKEYLHQHPEVVNELLF